MNGFKQPPEVALIAAIVVAYVLFWKNIESPTKTLNEGAVTGIMPIINMCAAVGFGGAIAAVPGFKVIASGVLNMPEPLTVKLAIAACDFSSSWFSICRFACHA